MFKICLLCWFILSCTITVANTKHERINQHAEIDPTLISVGKKYVSKIDFEILFVAWLKEYYPNKTPALSSADEFLDAFVKYQLLVQQANKFFKNNKQELISDFNIFLAEKTDSKKLYRRVEEEITREAFFRSHYLVDADHILLSFNKDNAAESKTSLYNKALQLKSTLDSGEASFEQLAYKYSDDPYSADNSGKIGIFTVFEQIYPIESAVYELDINVISAPIESRFGYHLVRTKNKIKTDGLKSVSHILIKIPGNNIDAERKIFDIYSRLTKGNFSKLAKQYSDDYKSSVIGGDLGTNRLIYELELKKHELTTQSISPPFKSSIGWHIMKADKLIEFKPFWQQRLNLKQMIQLDSRTERAIDSLKTDHPLKPMQKVVQSYWEYFMTLNMLRKTEPNLKLEVSTDLELIKTIYDSTLRINFTELEQEFPIKIDSARLHELFN